MPDAVSRAKRYEERATECRRLATLASSAESRIGYEQLADGYLKVAEAELGLAQEWAARDAKGFSAFVSDSAARKKRHAPRAQRSKVGNTPWGVQVA